MIPEITTFAVREALTELDLTAHRTRSTRGVVTSRMRREPSPAATWVRYTDR
jgi:hypothetical protein